MGPRARLGNFGECSADVATVANAGCDTDPSPPSSAIGDERVELYLYSPYGLYGEPQCLYKGALYLLQMMMSCDG
jgi:hypothetical protein